MSVVKHFTKNLLGRDFVVGDIHGEFSKLERQLKQLDFDEAYDRLFSVGDLIDRGPESDEAADWVVRKEWFHSVAGNHDWMPADALNPSYPNACGNHFINGGQWFYGLPEVEQQCIAIVLKDLPLAIEVETDQGLIGIIHAEVPLNDWNLFQTLYPDNIDYFTSVAQWARKRISQGYTGVVEGVDKVYVGHTPTQDGRELVLGNVHYIDSGAVFGRDFLIIQIQ